MKKIFYLFSKSLLSKLALMAILIVGGGNSAWADDIVIFDGGSSYGSGFSGGTITNGEIVCSSSMVSISSSTEITLSNHKLVICAKRTNTSDSYIKFGTYASYQLTAITTFGYGTTTQSYELFCDNYIELISDNITKTASNFRFQAKNITIKSIKFVQDKELYLDEESPTALVKGSKSESVRVKYQPVSGWNTICMPFQLRRTVSPSYDHLETIFGEGYSIYSLDNYSDGVLTFTSAKAGVSSNTPYLVYAPNAPTHTNGVELTNNVSIAPYVTDTNLKDKSVFVFQGTYAPITAGNFTSDMYGVTSAGQVRPGDGVNANMKGYRAYFTGISAPSTPGARISIVFEDDGETTDLGFVKMIDPEAQDVYTLSGQKVKKGGKGIYIVNGRKVVIK